MEINDIDVTTLSPRELNELLHRHYGEAEGVKIVVARLFSSDDTDNGEGVDNVIDRYKKLNSSLSIRLESQNAEVDHWRQECNRYIYASRTYSSVKSNVFILKAQV